ncbi:hypothetical protein D2A34_14445 [Clostridium chromiireducens]|uniref:Uncharacterized protein n=1 Tax=Clostridium chromiireducens TaxID=225345 RepID=A0A399IMU9_9CLOT|nr:hypothetical protein [Clostridium chromiireducens]RII34340.1 hypothetical protein D2A34_14445 [Clostridium chromiireducens]
MLTDRQQNQINELIGKKVKIVISFKSHVKVLRQDENGLYIRFKNQRVPCKPDTNTLNILFFTALDPKYRKLI